MRPAPMLIISIVTAEKQSKSNPQYQGITALVLFPKNIWTAHMDEHEYLSPSYRRSDSGSRYCRVTGKITERNFSMLSGKYQAEQETLAQTIDSLQQQLAQGTQESADAEKWISLIKQYTAPAELTAELLNALVEKILVHEAEKDENGNRVQKVEIYYRFIGKID